MKQTNNSTSILRDLKNISIIDKTIRKISAKIYRRPE